MFLITLSRWGCWFDPHFWLIMPKSVVNLGTKKLQKSVHTPPNVPGSSGLRSYQVITTAQNVLYWSISNIAFPNFEAFPNTPSMSLVRSSYTLKVTRDILVVKESKSTSDQYGARQGSVSWGGYVPKFRGFIWYMEFLNLNNPFGQICGKLRSYIIQANVTKTIEKDSAIKIELIPFDRTFVSLLSYRNTCGSSREKRNCVGTRARSGVFPCTYIQMSIWIYIPFCKK